MIRIVAGRWRGRRLRAPAGTATRPTADRVRQALFDMLMHAPWARGDIAGAEVLDVFAGTGAMGLEALSRGAARAGFIERDPAALAALRANIAACGADAEADVIVADALAPPPGRPANLIFLDPPYGQNLVPRALAALAGAGWIAPGALIIAEAERDAPPPDLSGLGLGAPLAERSHGAARLAIWRSGSEIARSR
ncbi:MAG: 16S rRNA (guanine(966)-N(2))-methyltransferase RsmD [Rhodospirillales bacterium]|nr:16S rRNA (guanine(966)-N(2))-methyltransferase RsmD [Rhodospirillales bacterium]